VKNQPFIPLIPALSRPGRGGIQEIFDPLSIFVQKVGLKTIALFHLKLQGGLAKRNPTFGCSAPKYLHSFK
jgi:hypothetical protein